MPSEGCKSMSRGRADGAALFKYLMELTGGGDLVKLGGKLKVRFPKQRPQLPNYGRSVIEVTNEKNMCAEVFQCSNGEQ